MGRYKICVYAICKNEARFVQRWMDSASEADEVVVLDTGSTDGTAEKLAERGASVYVKTINPWRFDTARNTALHYMPKDTDICVSVDLDEIFAPGWREKLENAWSPRCTRARYWFNWRFDAEGNPLERFHMEKAHRRNNFFWKRPVHEELQYCGTDKEHTVFVEGMLLNHYADIEKPRTQYLPLLELAVKEDPSDDRAMFWLGREYYFYRCYDKAIETLTRHLSLPTAVWDVERSAAARFIASCYEAVKDFQEARRWLYRAISECSGVREPYLALARLGVLERDWPAVYAMARMGLEVEETACTYLTFPACRGRALYDLAALGALGLNLWKEAARYVSHV